MAFLNFTGKYNNEKHLNVPKIKKATKSIVCYVLTKGVPVGHMLLAWPGGPTPPLVAVSVGALPLKKEGMTEIMTYIITNLEELEDYWD